MISAKLISHPLQFRFPAGTSRGVLNEKPTWFIHLQHSLTGAIGIGECSIIPGLSLDNPKLIESKLTQLIEKINSKEIPSLSEYNQFPAIQFALETALNDMAYENAFSPYPGNFDTGKEVPINGLVWMGDKKFMSDQIQAKLAAGYSCLKMKIGAIDFATELDILKSIRDKYSPDQIELRVDANGAFSTTEAMNKLTQLAEFNIHSIEQPIKQDQWKDMAQLCANSPIPIALDEELIGISDKAFKIQMLDFIRPQYIILKPSLVGGIEASDEWIEIAEKSNIGWWATSALESNIGLNAIAQWVSNKNSTMPQGLGTGQLFTNNIESPLTINNGHLTTTKRKKWDTQIFQ
jgi:o-succinylbenzoate synthase